MIAIQRAQCDFEHETQARAKLSEVLDKVEATQNSVAYAAQMRTVIVTKEALANRTPKAKFIACALLMSRGISFDEQNSFEAFRGSKSIW